MTRPGPNLWRKGETEVTIRLWLLKKVRSVKLEEVRLEEVRSEEVRLEEKVR